jgi:peptidyl-tRNA hydrolase, PTH2 family
MIKQVIIMRTDLNMRKGKMCAQASHASMKIFFDRMKDISYAKEITDNQFYCHFTPEMIEWMQGSFTKIVVGCNSEEELLDLKKQADDAGIVNALILDNGMTEFKQVCPDCEGTGIYLPSGDVCLDCLSCFKCSGTGKINKQTYTALAIGPDEAEKIDKITKELKLL